MRWSRFFPGTASAWVRRHGGEAGLDDVGQVGTTQVACREHRGYEVDVVAISRSTAARTKGARITVLGEAKCTNKQCTGAELVRLQHIRDLLVSRGWDAGQARFVLFSRTGFAPELHEMPDVRLVDLDGLYGVHQRKTG